MKSNVYPCSPHLRVIATLLLICCAFFVFYGAMSTASVFAQDGSSSSMTTSPTPVPPEVPGDMPPPNMPVPEPPYIESDCEGSATISGTVLDSDGNLASDVYISIHTVIDSSGPDPMGGIWCGEAHLDGDGAFTTVGLAAGTYLLYFSPSYEYSADGMVAPEPVIITVADGETAKLDEPVQMVDAQAFVQVIVPGAQPGVLFASVLLGSVNIDGGCNDHLNYSDHLRYYPLLSEDGIAYLDGLTPGDYCMDVEVDLPSMGGGDSVTIAWMPPPPVLVTILDDANMLDLGQITFIEPTKRIVGSVVDDAGVGIAGVWVDALNEPSTPYNGMQLGAVTDETGSFEMLVGGGVWNLNTYVENTVGHIADANRTVIFAADDSAEELIVQFVAQRINSQVSGRLVNADGSPLNVGESMGLIQMGANGIDVEFHGHTEPNQDGTFTMPLLPGTYMVNVYVEPWVFSGLLVPAPFEVTLSEGQTLDLGDIRFSSPQVTAQIVAQDGTTPAAGDYIITSEYDHDGDGVAGCEELGGNFEMPGPATMPDVDSMPHPDYISVYGYILETGMMQVGGLPVGDYCLLVTLYGDGSTYMSPIKETFTIDDESALLDLGTLAPAASTKFVSGRVVKADGTGVAEININASKHNDPYGGWAATHTDADGNFTLNLTGGEWGIAIDLYSTYLPGGGHPELDLILSDPHHGTSQIWFTEEAMKLVTFADDATEEAQDVEFTVSEATSTITGMLLKPDGTPATGIGGEVNAQSELFSHSWAIGYIDPETASYEVSVVGGEWLVGFNLQSDGYGDSTGDYVEHGPLVTVNVADGSTAQQDFTLQMYDTTIRGTVLNADGSPITYGYAWINSVVDGNDLDATAQYISRYAEIVDGAFEVKVLSGFTYEVGVEKFDPSGSDTGLQPSMQVVTPQPDSVTEVVMQFLEPDAAIVGTVLITDTTAGTSTSVAANAEVSAWSQNGQHRWTIADENGAYTLTVQSGSTWYVSAWWHDSLGHPPYHTSGEIEVVVAQAGQINQDLFIVAEDYLLPESMETVFEVNEAHSVTLDDGTVIDIPSGAIPVEDTDGEDVRMVITPLTAGLPNSYATDAVDYGYDIQIYNQHSGDEVTADLNADIVITYQYEDATLAKMDADESTLAPVVRTTRDSKWGAADIFVVNPDKNEIRLSVGQASEAAMTVRPRRPAASDNDGGTTTLPSEEVVDYSFLPLIFE